MMNAILSVKPVDSVSLESVVEKWLRRFELALRDVNDDRLSALFSDDCHWRDMFAFTWTISPRNGKPEIVQLLLDRQRQVKAKNFAIVPGAPLRLVTLLGVSAVEAIFSFETEFSRGRGVVRLLPSTEKAWMLMTSLHEIKGHEESILRNRPEGSNWREFGGPNWADRRRSEQAFDDRDPVVLIVGAGQNGLALAARLRVHGIDALCVDKHKRVGDSWRKRYHSLALHNRVSLNQLPYMPFPSNWPKYLPKDMVANWLEHYAWAMECNIWMDSALVNAHYVADESHWIAEVRKPDGSVREMKPRHIVLANGIVGAPNTPALPGLGDFNGKVIHTHDYTSGAEWEGKRALVLGTGTSGHDIAQDLFGHGAEVTIIQRSATAIASVEAVGLEYDLYYREDLPTEYCDLIGQCTTYPTAVRSAQAVAKAQSDIDRELLAGLRARGFKVDPGEDGTGYIMKARRTHAGYYFNCGASELIVEGKVHLMQFDQIEKFVENGVLLKDGSVVAADLLITATGYQPQQEVVRDLLGNEVADEVGPIWGLDSEGELSNMYKPTAQEGLWFLGSGFSQARIFTHYVALQIKARELGLVV